MLELAAARMRRTPRGAIAEDPEVAALLDRVVRRELDPASAATELLERGCCGRALGHRFKRTAGGR